MPLGLRTPGTWSPEQARAAGDKGRASRARFLAARRLKAKRLERLALDPPSSLPSLLRDQIAGASLHLEKAQREGKAKALNEWIGVVRRLVELERYVSAPNTRNKNSAEVKSPAAAPRLVSSKTSPAENSSSTPDQVAGGGAAPGPNQVAGQSSTSNLVTSPAGDQLDDVEPLEHAPLD